MAPHSHAVVLPSTVPEGLKAPGSGWDIQSIDPPRPPSGSILPGVAGEIASVLRELGADPAPVFRAAGLDPAMSTDPNAIIPLGAFCALIARSGACTGCPHFGLLLGQRVQLPALGLVGSLMLHSETVGDALRSLIRHVEMQCMGATTALTANDGTAVWSCVVYEPGTDCADQVADAAAAAATNVMRALCGGDWSPTEVHLPRAVPEDQPTYRRLFRAPVRFNREAAALVFPALHLDRVLQGADPVLLRTLQDKLQERTRGSAPDFVARLRQLLRTELMRGGCSAEKVAGLLAMHRRTLARRLSAEGTAFSIMADEGRFEIARQLIDHTDIPLAQIAAALDFSEASAFTRAFRRWSGQTPSAWRMEHRRFASS